ncbi:betaine/proline/choline family ABC transporter ATP-binding protein [Eubacteriaceae bacterium ES3]|nr:betaine/proline/choline family ABC transporter ATP-binding protein [Eubacteriaceae bacterium ES3]
MEDYKVSIKDLTLVFGKKPERALQMLDEGKSIQEVREETGLAVGVNNISLDIEEGEMFVIVGLSGSGKSSLIRCLNMLNIPTRGQVLIDGENICEYDKNQLQHLRRKKVAMVFQHFGLFSHRNVLRNVEYGLEVQNVSPEERKEKAEEAIKLVGLEGWETYFPKHLSGGMKQRVGLARALTNEPEILLMDEPFSALDPLIRREMQTELLSMEAYINKTIIFITHDMNEAFRLGDRVALLKDGALVQLGKPKDFFENPANDYVRSFTEDVDKSRILRVKSIMRKPIVLAKPAEKAQDVLKRLEENNRDFCYVVDDQTKVLLGYVETQTLAEQGDKTIQQFIIEELETIESNAFVYEAFSKLDESAYDIAVIDKKKRLRGVVSTEEVVAALTH